MINNRRQAEKCFVLSSIRDDNHRLFVSYHPDTFIQRRWKSFDESRYIKSRGRLNTACQKTFWMFDNCKLLEDTCLIPGVIDKTRKKEKEEQKKREMVETKRGWLHSVAEARIEMTGRVVKVKLPRHFPPETFSSSSVSRPVPPVFPPFLRYTCKG